MICKIADLGVDVPELGDLPERCRPYFADVPVDVVIDPSKVYAGEKADASRQYVSYRNTDL